MNYPVNTGLPNSYQYGQQGQYNPLYHNNYNPNSYSYGSPYANNGLQGVDYSMISGGNNAYSSMGQAGSNPGAGLSSAVNIAGSAVQAAGTTYEMVQDVNNIRDYDINKVLPGQVYNPRSAPPTYYEQETPDQISKGTGFRTGVKNAGKGAASGAALGAAVGSVVPGVGTVIGGAVGGAVGTVGGAVSGIVAGSKAKQKREEFEDRIDQQKRDYAYALNRYYDIQNTNNINQARRNMYDQRGQNLTPMYTAGVYGLI